MKSIHFTVVVPVYNSSDFIVDTIKSIRDASENDNYEVLIVDDCSDDIKTLRTIIERYPECRLIEKDEKSNAAVSRNIGLSQANGDYIFLLDSDDHFIPNNIDRRIKLHAQTGSSIIFGDFITKREANEKTAYVPPYYNEDIRDYLFVKNGDFRTSTVSICIDKYKNTLFDPLSYKHQDWIFAIRCFDNTEKIFFDNKPSAIINIERVGRMSASLNLGASQYLCENYLKNISYVNHLSKKNWKTMIYNKDKMACNFFFSIFKPTSFKETFVFLGYRLAASWPLLHFSSLLIGHVRKKRKRLS